MAHNIIGLDLGSHTVKAVEVRMTMRGPEIIGVDVEQVQLDDQGRSTQQEMMAAAGRLVKRVAEEFDTVHASVPGESVALRTVTLPKAAARRADQVLRYELDDSIPYNIDDAVFDYIEVNRDDDTVTFLCAVVQSEMVSDLIEGLNAYNVDPREIGTVGLSYTALARQTWTDLSAEDVVAVVDLGHQRTDIFIVGDQVPTTRTLLRGGRDLTQAVADHWKIPFAEAQDHKERDGLFGQVGEKLREALRPAVREIRQTLKGHEARGGLPVTRVALVGGGAQLRGLADYLAQELHVDVSVSENALGKAVKAKLPAEQLQRCTLAYALTLRESMPASETINLRRGEHSFRGDLQFLRKRVGWMIVCIAAVLAAWIFASYAEYRMLNSQSDELRAQLGEVTKSTFGKPLYTKELIAGELGSLQMEKPPMPTIDAFDILVELSKRIPEKVVHDVELLEIKPKRITLKGIVDPELKVSAGKDAAASPDVPFGEESFGDEESVGEEGSEAGEFDETELSATDYIKQELEKFTECFTAIRVGKVTALGDRRKYQMDIDTTCP